MTHEQSWDPVHGPMDPFFGDSADPSQSLDDLEPLDALTDTDRAEIEADLAELAEFEGVLGSHGIRGIVVDCGDCSEQHFFSWALMKANLFHLLRTGRTGVHEPAVSPDPDHYVSWDYARGFADALAAPRL